MPAKRGFSIAEAKIEIVNLAGQGIRIEDALTVIGRHYKTYENWRSNDREFARSVDEARARFKRAKAAGQDSSASNLSFEEWRHRFLKRDTYPHQRMWIDILEGRDPQVVHGSIRWEPRNRNRLLVNTPPFHSKSTVITTEYVVYRICRNPNIRVKIVSKTREKAAEFVYAVKRMLTAPQFAEMQAAYAPTSRDGVPSFKSAEGAWTATKIYVAGRGEDAADAASKDPTVEALGIRGQIYGSRADLIVVDDAITMENAAEHEKQLKWIRQEVLSRVFNGKVIIVGTRVASVDLYSEIRNGDNFSGGVTNWSYLAQPAVLEYADDPNDWVTLWPRSSQPMDEEDPGDPDENGLWPAWNGPALEGARSSMDEKTWALVYMQSEVAEDAVFHPKCIEGSVDGRRKAGPLIAGAWGHPLRGAEGMHVIGSIDPAGTGEAFVLVYAAERSTGKRFVLNCWMANHTTPEWYADQIETITPVYGVREWVIESNAYASWLIHDRRITDYCRMRGVTISPTFTGKNKQDPDFGVASMASLFGTIRRIHEGSGREEHNGDNIIWLPDKSKHAAMQALVSQLCTWQPNKRGGKLRQDGPMALWFAELRARVVLGQTQRQAQSHVKHRFLTRRHTARQAVRPAGLFGGAT